MTSEEEWKKLSSRERQATLAQTNVLILPDPSSPPPPEFDRELLRSLTGSMTQPFPVHGKPI